MKMFDIDGEFISVDVRPSSYPIKSKSKSSLQGKVGQYLIERFPRNNILEEFTIPNSRLSIDFFISDLGLAIEIDGEQHSKFIPFFHGDKNQLKFAGQIKRDIKKEQWCEINGFTLIRIIDEKDIDKI
jgi:hypothetical protein